MQKRKNNLVLVLLALALNVFAPGGSAEAALELKDRDKNGGNFIFESDPRALVTTIDIVIFAGAAHDPKGKEGLANLAFDSILRGTKKKSRDEFAYAIESLGGTINSSSRFIRSAISLDVINENVEPAVNLLAEALLEPGLRAREIEQLHKQRLAQLDHMRSSPPSMLFHAMREEIFRGTPLSHSPDGTIDSVSRITLDDIRLFLIAQIKSGNILVAANSKIEKEKLKAIIEKAFARLPEGPATAIPSIQIPKIKGRHLIILDRKGLTTAPAAIAHPSVASTYEFLEEVELGNFILGGESMTSRLFNVLRNENGWTYGVSSQFHQFDTPRKYGGVFSIYTFPATEHALQAIPKAVELYQDYEKNGITEDELNFAKNSMINSYAFSFVSASERIGGRVSEALDGRPYLSIEEYKRRLSAVTPAELQQKIHEAHDSANFILGVAGDPEQMRELMNKVPNIQSVKVVKDPIQKLSE